MKDISLARKLTVGALTLSLCGTGWQIQRAQAQFGGQGYSGSACAEDVDSRVTALSQRVDALSHTMPTPVITMDEGHLYIVRGTTLYIVSKTSPSQFGRVELEPVTVPTAPSTPHNAPGSFGGQGGFPGGGRGGFGGGSFGGSIGNGGGF